MTRAHPGHPDRRRPGRRHRPPGRPTGSRSTTSCAAGWPRSATVVDRRRRPGRGRPRLVAAGHRLGRRRAGPGPARGGGPAHRHRPGGRRCSPLCHEARVPVTPAGGRSGVCGASVPLFGGVALDLCGLAGIGDVDTDVAGGRPAGRHLRPRRGVGPAGRLRR